MTMTNPTEYPVLEFNGKELKPFDFIEVPPEVLPNVEYNPNESTNLLKKCFKWTKNYAKKFRGLKENRPPRLEWQEYLWSFLGSFVSILTLALLHYRLVSQHSLIYVIGSFGASTILIYGAPRSPFSQPRNLIGGHLISATCGCIMRISIAGFEPSVAAALSVGISIMAMQFTETTHPPGGATALLAVIMQPTLPWKNFCFIFMPVLTGVSTILLIALFINNLAPKRSYPSFWW